MSKFPHISDAEWEIMRVLWARFPLTAADVINALGPYHDWHPRTIKTMLGRLVKKGALGFTVDGNRYCYAPKVSRQQCIGQATRQFLRRIFGGDTSLALLHFAKLTDLSNEDVEQLKKLLDDKTPSS